MPYFRNLRCFFHRLMQEEFFQHTIPIIPRIAYGRMVHRHCLHTPAVAQEISARRRPAPVHYYRLAVLPSLARHLVPKALAPNDDIMLADEGLKEYVVCHKLEPWTDPIINYKTQAGRWLVDICKTEAIYQPLTHFPTTRYTPAGRYGGFFAFTAIKILALMVSFIMLTDFVSNNLYKPSRKNLRRWMCVMPSSSFFVS